MIVTDLSGNVEMVTDYKNLKRKRRVNGEHSLSFLLYKTDNNKHAYDLVQTFSTIEYDNNEYVIKEVKKQVLGNQEYKEIFARHKFFELVNKQQYDIISGTLTIEQCLDHALQDTGYTYSVVDSYDPVEFEEFGRGTPIELISTIVEEFITEYEVDGTHLTFKKQIGNETDYQIRYKRNLKTYKYTENIDNLSTYIKGYGKGIEANYTSPMADVYGILHAKPITDERYKYVDSLREKLKRVINDSPEISFEVDFFELKKAGFEGEYIDLGDSVYVIHEPLGIDYMARVIEYTEYPEEPKNSKIVLANFKKNILSELKDFKKTQNRVENILTQGGNIRYDVLDERVKISTEALQNSMTELEYPANGGIIARNPDNTNELVVFNSIGLGISDDNGQTFKEAITAKGFNLTVGAIGQLDANNIRIGSGTTFDTGYDPSTKETPEGAQQKADQAEQNAKNYAVGKNVEYNGVVINSTDGIKITGKDANGNPTGVVTILNATNGIRITDDGDDKFYVDTDGVVTLDGRVRLTNTWGGIDYVNADLYFDNQGGKLDLFSNRGENRVYLGSEGYDGGKLTLYYGDGATPYWDMGIDYTDGSFVEMRSPSGYNLITMRANEEYGHRGEIQVDHRDSSGFRLTSVTIRGYGISISDVGGFGLEPNGDNPIHFAVDGNSRFKGYLKIDSTPTPHVEPYIGWQGILYMDEYGDIHYYFDGSWRTLDWH